MWDPFVTHRNKQSKRNVPAEEKIRDIQAWSEIGPWHKKSVFHWDLLSQPQYKFSFANITGMHELKTKLCIKNSLLQLVASKCV
jgi:hypothetical protein